MRFQDQVVIVTGGSQGIGRAYVRAFNAEGAKVVIADVADPGDFPGEFEGDSCVYVETDIRREESTLAMAESTLGRFGRIDVLVNNAARPGRTARWDLMDIKLEDWDEVYSVNVRGTMLCTRAVVPAFEKAGRGKIVNIASDSFVEGASAAASAMRSSSNSSKQRPVSAWRARLPEKVCQRQMTVSQ